MTSPRILVFDVETSPLVSLTWGTFKQNVIKVQQDFRILSVAWKWHGKAKVYDASIPEWEGFDGDMSNDYGVVATIMDLFDEADVVVAHNNDGFDQPKVLTRAWLHGMDPPIPFKHVDTLKVIRQNFRLTSNRLDNVCQALGLGGKAETGGIGTWEGCMAGDEKAWRQMVKYNRHDVVLLDGLYTYLQPWAERGPNLAAFGDKPDACPKCGAVGTMALKGWRNNAVTRRRIWRCGACRGIVASRALEKIDVSHTHVP
jgi:DNA polymerase elongation subunit (family B)